MEQLFLTTLNLSLAASVLGLVLLGLRALLRSRLPRWVFYLAWVLVAARLLLPVSLPSDYSIFNLLPTASSSGQLAFVQEQGQTVNFPTLQPAPSLAPQRPDSAVTAPPPAPQGPSSAATAPDSAAPPPQSKVVAPAAVPVTTILATVWVCGVLLFCGYSLLCYGYTRKRLRSGTRLQQVTVGRRQLPVVQCSLFASPVVCGVWCPIVVLPAGVTEATAALVLSHECTHIRRLDNLWQGVATLLLYLHWFNPLCWVFHRCFVADMEVSCDQAVCKTQPPRAYAAALVELSEQNKNRLCGGFLAFGESFLAERVRAVLRTRQLNPRLVLAVVAVALGLVVVFLTNPATPPVPPPISAGTAPAMPNPAPQRPDSGVTPPAPQSPSSAATAPDSGVTPPSSAATAPESAVTAQPSITLIDKQNRVAVRLPAQQSTQVLQLLSDLTLAPQGPDSGVTPPAPQGPSSAATAPPPLRLLQLRMPDGSKRELLLYPDSMTEGDTTYPLPPALTALLPDCGSFPEAGWGAVMPEWLGYMNPLRITSATVQLGEHQRQMTTRDSAAARDQILWLAEQLCGINVTTGEQQAPGATMQDSAALTITLDFLESKDSYRLDFYPQTEQLRIQTTSLGYAIDYPFAAAQLSALSKSIAAELLE